MFCAKINTNCPHRVFMDSSYVFVLMPFQNSESIFDCIKQAVETLPTKKFTCDRADMKYTSSDIWCQKICRAIRRAKYLIVDTTGLNANVFYELGFAHALGQTRNIIITQNIKQLPFDVSGFSAIEYTEKNFPKLRSDLQKALTDLEAETQQQAPVQQSTEDIIQKLKTQIRAEEERSEKFKKEARAAEHDIEKLKRQIVEIEAIQRNPEREANKLIVEKEQKIKKLQHELSQADQQKKDEVNLLQKRLEEEQQLRQRLEQELAKFNQTGDTAKLTQTTSETKTKDWQTEIFNQGKKLTEEKKFEEAIAIFTQLIEKAPDYQSAFWYRAFCLSKLKDFEGAVSDWTKAIELDPQDAIAFYNRGFTYDSLKDYDRAIADYNKAIALDPKCIYAYLNLAEFLIMAGKIDDAEQTARSAIQLAESIADQAISKYLLAVSLKIQGKSTAEIDLELEQLYTKEFETAWSFDEFESWLEQADISKEIKSNIREKTKMLKKHKK